MSYRITLESDSPIRVVSTEVPPAPPPLPPPPPPPGTGEPFQWPPEPFLPSRDDQRYASLGQSFYVGEGQFTNPLPQSNRFAGYIEAHAMVGAWDIYAYRLWAPRDANPDLIRQVLKTGRV